MHKTELPAFIMQCAFRQENDWKGEVGDIETANKSLVPGMSWKKRFPDPRPDHKPWANKPV